MIGQFSEQDLCLLKQSPLFAGMSDEEMRQCLEVLKVRKRNFAKGELIQRVGEPFRYAGFVLKGVVQVSFITEMYDNVELARFERGDTFGLAQSISQVEHSTVQIRAVAASEVVLMDFWVSCLPKEITGIKTALTLNTVSTLVKQNRFLQRRVVVLGQGSIRNRLICYLMGCEVDSRGFAYVSLSRTELAAYLGVNRSALSREISRMAKDGVLEVDGNRMRLI